MTLKDVRYDLNKVLRFASVLVLFIFFILIFLGKPVQNSDFWWHLATGKNIVRTGTISEKDPFAYTTTDRYLVKKPIILKGNWLAQVIFYLMYSLGEEKGIILLRTLLMIIFVFFSFLTMLRRKIPLPVVLIFTLVVFAVARGYSGERPQLFTFAIFSAVIFICEEFRRTGSKAVLVLPLLVLLSANFHPGFIVHFLVIGCYLLSELIKHFFLGRKDIRKVVLIFAAWSLSIMFSMINPNGPLLLLNIFSIHDESMRGIVEFMPAYFVYMNKLGTINYYHIVFVCLSVLSIRYIRKMDIAHILLLTGFAYMSIYAIRYIVFFVCVAAPILAGNVALFMEERRIQMILKRIRVKEVFVNLVIMVLVSVYFLNAVPRLRSYSFGTDTFLSAPKGAADFLEKVNIKGNMFNEYGFGGYLLWRLAPEKKVFIDGRQLETSVYEEYQKVVRFEKKGPETWDEILNKYNATYIVTPPIFYYGMIVPLVEHLYDSDEWHLVYLDQLSLIFVREGTGNEDVIEKYGIDKEKALNTIIVQASAHALRNKTNPAYLISIAKAFYKMGKYDEAEKALQRAKERDPANKLVDFWIEKVRLEGPDRKETGQQEGAE